MRRTALLGCLLAIAAVVPACGQTKPAAPKPAATAAKAAPPATAATAAKAPAQEPAAAPTGPVTSSTLTYGRFGTVYVYRTSPHPKHVVLFLSGDGGWNKGVVDMAKTLATLDSLVLGIDLPHYLKKLAASKEKCSYPPGDLELLSKVAQRELNLPAYIHPVVVGYSSGATLAYVALVQAPPRTFLGAISMGFCPDLEITKPMCNADGALKWGPNPGGKGVSFLPASNLEVPWIALQGTIDKVCSTTDDESYIKKVKNGQIVLLPKVGHGFSVTPRWEPQFRDAFNRIVKAGEPVPAPVQTAAAPGAAPSRDAAIPLDDLPITEVKATGPSGATGDMLAVMISGDGGWVGIDNGVSGALAEKGIPVAGLSSLQYFWKTRTPEEASKDLERMLRHYLAAWNKQRAVLVGYSLGADVLPFMVNRLPADLQQRIRLITLLAPSKTTSFEFHLTDWVGGSNNTDVPVFPEVAKLNRPILCLYGESEKDSLCHDITPQHGKAVALPGSHHFEGDYPGLAGRILAELGTAPGAGGAAAAAGNAGAAGSKGTSR